MPGPTSTDRQGSIDVSDDSDWGWWWLFHSLKGMSKRRRRQSTRVLEYWTTLSRSERKDEKQQYYRREPNSTEMGWTEFYAACHLLQTCSASDLTRALEQDDNFTKAYCNLDARIVASLTDNSRPRDSVSGMGARESMSSNQLTRRSHMSTRQSGDDDDPPPPYESVQTDHAADRPPPYDARSPGRSRHEQWLNPGRFLNFVTRIFASTHVGPSYLLPPFRDEPRSSRNTPSGNGSSASSARQHDSRQRPRLTR